MASVAPSTDQRVMSPLCSFSALAPAAAERRNVSPPSNPVAAIAKVLVVEQMLGRRRRLRSSLGSGSGSSDGVRKILVATRDIRCGLVGEREGHAAEFLSLEAWTEAWS
jgi:hypothetical protein